MGKGGGNSECRRQVSMDAGHAYGTAVAALDLAFTKHLRGAIETAERSVVELMSRPNQRLWVPEDSLLPAGSKWYGHDVAVANRLLSRYGTQLLSTAHNGNSYDRPGDLALNLADHDGVRQLYVELKMSATRTGKGTSAGLSQNVLSQKLLGDDCLSWEQWRKNTGYLTKIQELLDTLPETLPVDKLADKGRVVREAAKQGDDQAKAVKAAIMRLSAYDRRRYAQQLPLTSADPEQLQRFSRAVLHGRNHDSLLSYAMDRPLDQPLDEAGSFVTVYTNRSKDGNVVVTMDQEGALDERLSQMSDWRIGQRDKSLDLEITAVSPNGERQQVLRLRHHWKNVFSGIETPCTMIYMGAWSRRQLGRS